MKKKKKKKKVHLDTVAGDALSMSCGSKMSLQLTIMGSLSPLASVSVLLSSSTEFRFSIHSGSTGPSKTSQMCSPFLACVAGEELGSCHSSNSKIDLLRVDMKGVFFLLKLPYTRC